MKKEPNRIREWRLRRRMSQATLGKLMNPPCAKSKISKIETGEQKISEADLKSLSKALNCEIGDLLAPDLIPAMNGHVIKMKHPETQLKRELSSIYPENIYDVVPLYGPASAGFEKIYITEDNVIGERARPPELQGIKGGFRMLVKGDCMEPRHFDGEEVSVHPFKRPAINEDCIIVMEPDGNAQVKRYMGETAKEIKLGQWNPKMEFTIPRNEVRFIYAVVR